VKDGSHVRLRHPSCVYITEVCREEMEKEDEDEKK